MTNLIYDDYGVRIWVVVAAGLLVVSLFIGFLVWATNREERIRDERITECVERTDDPAWCLEVIE